MQGRDPAFCYKFARLQNHEYQSQYGRRSFYSGKQLALYNLNQLRTGRDEPYRVCRRVNILRDYPDDKTKLYPRN
ncbi:hypothetical protein AhaeAN43_03860 [Acinetobacter haemolyticus]|uniref:Uncharacterized protein n=1 Tax=Acinetobacter haemolyticus TaxID=29430 RepID=A0A857IHX3_ACIHA|nr:hypothetical protein AhaeAN43_03860 [Acinetobacter haemolyticus]